MSSAMNIKSDPLIGYALLPIHWLDTPGQMPLLFMNMQLFQYLALYLITAIGWPLLASAEPVGNPIEINELIKSKDPYMGIQLMGSLSLKGNPALAELSGLAWDEDEQTLLAISDRGWLLHLLPIFENGNLIQADLQKIRVLKDRHGKPLRGSWRDSEGLTLENSENGVSGDTSLIISFERHNRIERYTLDGEWVKTEPLPKLLEQTSFQPKGNKGLEAVTLHPQLGIITGPEYPPKGTPHYLVNSAGIKWYFTPKEPNGALVALEALPNGDLILLERAYTSIFAPWVISLTQIKMADLVPDNQVSSTLIARFDSSEGWLTQNLEGLTRHQGMHFFMVSDDGNKPWAQTQLIYFKLLQP
ncbi:MAG: esterase-like activity of phytase family protein [Sedimenticola thiotaurini]|uniref:Esterase-like activity of phytase family protein n=1 Tax=Sedimenticola thiotaurini TaxID=1543721 RepID=A0A558CTY1_9GAMM|nr:MAG: esterase-like activity of phytase family protein [Sedimenticola thiotaurini]